MTDTKLDQAIEVTENGPYHVTGGIPLKRVERVTNEKGKFVDWRVYEEVATDDEYWLCRCGHSTEKPFCSGMHETVGFDGTETCPIDNYASRAEHLGGTKVSVHDDRGICAHAAFCSGAVTNVWKAAAKSDDDPEMARLAMGMIDNCPSGALTYTVDGQPGDTGLAREIWVMKDGSYIARGGIPITRADGQAIEIRNRMALCRCGGSKNKPLCDGTHFEIEFKDG